MKEIKILRYRENHFQVGIRYTFLWGLIKLRWLTPAHDNFYDKSDLFTNFTLAGTKCIRESYDDALIDYIRAMIRYGNKSKLIIGKAELKIKDLDTLIIDRLIDIKLDLENLLDKFHIDKTIDLLKGND